MRRTVKHHFWLFILPLTWMVSASDLSADEQLEQQLKNNQEIAKGEHDHNGSHHGGGHYGHHGHHGYHHPHGHDGHHWGHHHHDNWWYGDRGGYHHHDGHWNSWHHPWHNWYWYGGAAALTGLGAYGAYENASPGYYYDPNYYYLDSGTPSVEYEDDTLEDSSSSSSNSTTTIHSQTSSSFHSTILSINRMAKLTA